MQKSLINKFFLGVEPGHTAIIEPPGNRCISKCELPMRFGLPCKCWLYQCIIDQIPISSLTYSSTVVLQRTAICDFLEDEL